MKQKLYVTLQRERRGIQKPGVDAITNLSPAVQINHHHTNKNPRSTVLFLGFLNLMYTQKPS